MSDLTMSGKHDSVKHVEANGGKVIIYARNTSDLEKLHSLLGTEGFRSFVGEVQYDEALKTVLETDGGALFVVSLGALEPSGSALRLYGTIERLIMAERGLYLKHLGYEAVPLEETISNLMESDSLRALLKQVGVASEIETMLTIGNDARTKMDPSDVDQMKELHRNGITKSEIARRFGVSRATVARHLRKT